PRENETVDLYHGPIACMHRGYGRGTDGPEGPVVLDRSPPCLLRRPRRTLLHPLLEGINRVIRKFTGRRHLRFIGILHRLDQATLLRVAQNHERASTVARVRQMLRLIEPDSPLLLLGSMTLEAMLSENGTDLVLEEIELVRSGERCKEGGTGKAGKKHLASKHAGSPRDIRRNPSRDVHQSNFFSQDRLRLIYNQFTEPEKMLQPALDFRSCTQPCVDHRTELAPQQVTATQCPDSQGACGYSGNLADL